jgi:hypothetical protein
MSLWPALVTSADPTTPLPLTPLPRTHPEHNMSLTLTTSMNGTFKVPARGVGVASPLRLSYSVLRLGAAVPGEVLSSSLFLANTSSEPGGAVYTRNHCGNPCVIPRPI